ncbi:MAG: YceH family protein [Solirubrobacterales bacterium]
MIGPDDVEIRVLGCLVEKQRATPDQYPLTLNSLRLACNQSTNRAPVVDFDEATIRKALGELGRRSWIRSASGHTSRSAKYRQLIDVELNLPDDQISILAVLMLRGPQTPGELKQRVDRLHAFEDLAAVQSTLEDLIERDYVERLERRPGQKEERYRQLLGGGDASEAGPEEGDTLREVAGREPPDADRIERLEREVAELRAELEDLRSRLDS